MTNEQLIEQAVLAQKMAYVPYSGFPVGACLLCADGTIYKGANIENSSYGATICAERVAIFKAVSEGVRAFQKIAIVGGKRDSFTYPCGICRQVMQEFMPEGSVVLAANEKITEIPVKKLLPHAFTL